MKKTLIIRFSSFGDIVQCTSSAKALKTNQITKEIHFLTRTNFSDLVQNNPYVDHTYSYDKSTGLKGLLSLFYCLRKNHYDLIYDAHNNLRSNLLLLLFKIYGVLGPQKTPKMIQRSKFRFKRFLMFQLKIKSAKSQNPKGVLSYLEPIEKVFGKLKVPHTPHLYLKPDHASELNTLPSQFIAIAPSAAWKTKRWPLEYWKELVTLANDYCFIVLGGPNDLFCEEIAKLDRARIKNLAGKLSLKQSSLVISKSSLTISGDTGLLHVADQLGVLNIGLIGPTAFGYTTHSQSHILETNLNCKPCSKDGRNKCTNKIYQKCLTDITPEAVYNKAKELLPK